MGRSFVCSKTGLKRGAWTPEEDRLLFAYITRYGHWNWREIPKFAGLSRCGKSCRLRWMNYLRPDIKRGKYTREEEELISDLHAKLGNKWSAIAARLSGRTDNEIKNHWHSRLRKQTNMTSNNAETKHTIKCHELGGQDESIMNCVHPACSATTQNLKSSSHAQVSVSTSGFGSDIVGQLFSNEIELPLDSLIEFDENFWNDGTTSKENGSSDPVQQFEENLGVESLLVNTSDILPSPVNEFGAYFWMQAPFAEESLIPQEENNTSYKGEISVTEFGVDKTEISCNSVLEFHENFWNEEALSVDMYSFTSGNNFSEESEVSSYTFSGLEGAWTDPFMVGDL